jgi:large subunit ribosomal protein L22
MKAYLHSARIAPKKANLIAALVRGLTVEEAITQLEKTNKKGARLIEKLIASAAANAVHNDKQSRGQLRIQSIVVNQGMGMRRGVPMARGRIRPMRKFMSHIEVTLGLLTDPSTGSGQAAKKGAKKASKASQDGAAPVQESGSETKKPAAKKATTPKKSSSSSTK